MLNILSNILFVQTHNKSLSTQTNLYQTLLNKKRHVAVFFSAFKIKVNMFLFMVNRNFGISSRVIRCKCSTFLFKELVCYGIQQITVYTAIIHPKLCCAKRIWCNITCSVKKRIIVFSFFCMISRLFSILS